MPRAIVDLVVLVCFVCSWVSEASFLQNGKPGPMRMLATTTQARLSSDPYTKVFFFTGGEQSWTIPDGVKKIRVDLYGAQGNSYDAMQGGGSNMGGLGGYMSAEIDLTAIPMTSGLHDTFTGLSNNQCSATGLANVLYINVGGQYATNTFGGVEGAYNGGGQCGSMYSNCNGGGATDVRTVSKANNVYYTPSIASRIAIAGGGGGTVSYSDGTTGSGGGTNGVTGQNGVADNAGTQCAYNGGGGGSQTAIGDCGDTCLYDQNAQYCPAGTTYPQGIGQQGDVGNTLWNGYTNVPHFGGGGGGGGVVVDEELGALVRRRCAQAHNLCLCQLFPLVVIAVIFIAKVKVFVVVFLPPFLVILVILVLPIEAKSQRPL